MSAGKDKKGGGFNKRAFLKQKLKTNYGSKQEGHGRAFLQKKAVVRQYFRQQNREQKRLQKKKDYQLKTGGAVVSEPASTSHDLSLLQETDEEDSAFTHNPKKKLGSWQRARAEYKKKVSEKQQKAEEHVQRQKEIAEAKQRYKEKRLNRFKKLSQKTRKGQPVMRGRIELMLETLQQEMNTS